MAFEGRLFKRTRFGKYQHCLDLIEAYARLAPLWERLCLTVFAGAGPALGRLCGVDTSENWARADQVIADVLAVTKSSPAEVARHLRRYVRLKREGDDALSLDEARAAIYDQPFYPVVTHVTYALQPSAAARLNFVRQVVAGECARRGSVADLGCGSGVILSEILLLKPEWTGHGLDISPRAVAYARRLAAHKGVGGRATFREGCVTRLPYADESLNLVVASEVVEHMPEPERVAREIARVLKPGGQLVLTMPVESRTPAHAHTLQGAGELRELLRGAGLSVRRLEPRWHLGFGDDRRHVFALAEAPGRLDYVEPDALRHFPHAYPEPEAV
ncbi:MAG TPA: class I SAM-dependent methyltransferase [Pyrinomonadaceae bacterium]|nr:class I SAM-dependent methyltransferase [Pyrinomonadaceae bacterium]